VSERWSLDHSTDVWERDPHSRGRDAVDRIMSLPAVMRCPKCRAVQVAHHDELQITPSKDVRLRELLPELELEPLRGSRINHDDATARRSRADEKAREVERLQHQGAQRTWLGRRHLTGGPSKRDAAPDPPPAERGDDYPSGERGRMEELRRPLRLACVDGAEEWTRANIGRPMTADELGGLVGRYVGR
jgi:hypothetical protein